MRIRRHNRRPPAGLTLIEVTVAMALTGVLMAAMLRVVTRLSRDPAIRGTISDQRLLADRLYGLLAADVVHAERYRVEKGEKSPAGASEKGFSLQTRSSLAAKTLELRHLAATVTYELRRVGSETWLVRVQQAGGGEPTAGLICSGVRAVRIASSADGKAAGAAAGTPARARARAKKGWKSLAEITDVTVEFADGRAPLTFRFCRGRP